MDKQILLSIRPEHAVNVFNGNKKRELRLNVPKNFENIVKKYGGIWVNLYVTKGYHKLYKKDGKYMIYHYAGTGTIINFNELNGKVVARFWFDEYEKIYSEYEVYETGYEDYNYKIHRKTLNELCLEYEEVLDYGKGKNIFVWYIKQLEIFDEPKEINKFYTSYAYPHTINRGYSVAYVTPMKESLILKRPPQSWQYVYVEESEYK